LGRKILGVLGFCVAVALTASCMPVAPPPRPPANTDVLILGDSIGAGLGCMLGDPGGVTFPYPCPGVPGIDVSTEWVGACAISDGYLLEMGSPTSTANNRPNCWNWRSLFADHLDFYQPDLVVFVTGGLEIVDRWTSLPPGCVASSVKNCSPGADRQWASTDPQLVANAKAGFRDDLDEAIDLFRGAGMRALALNSAYFNPPGPSEPEPVWWEVYGPPLTANPPAQWTQLQANLNTPFGPSKTKIDNLNAEIEDAVADRNDPDVQLFDLWDLMTPLVGGVDEYSDFICVGPGDDLAQVDYDPGDCASVGATAVDVRHEDGGHLTERGNQIFLKAILPQIEAMLA
jgi:hypothetical protein